MRLSIKHPVISAYSRNDFAEAINAKKAVIELKGNVLQDVDKEINISKSTTKLSKLGQGAGALGVTLGLLSPAGYIGLGGGALYAILFGASSALLRADEINKYTIYTFTRYSVEHILLIRTKEYNAEFDLIEGYEDLIFNKSNHCPKCNKKGKRVNDVYVCPSCNRKIIRNSNAAIKMK